MQDGTAIPAEAAGEWLKEHFKGDPAPRVEITLMPAGSNPLVYQEVMEILFGPPSA